MVIDLRAVLTKFKFETVHFESQSLWDAILDRPVRPSYGNLLCETRPCQFLNRMSRKQFCSLICVREQDDFEIRSWNFGVLNQNIASLELQENSLRLFEIFKLKEFSEFSKSLLISFEFINSTNICSSSMKILRLCLMWPSEELVSLQSSSRIINPITRSTESVEQTVWAGEASERSRMMGRIRRKIIGFQKTFFVFRYPSIESFDL